MKNKTKPEWLRVKIPFGQNYVNIKSSLRKRNLHTVCEEAGCPNIAECWAGGTATIMIMGDTCTRGCRFCDVTSGNPLPPDPWEPERTAQAIEEWGLQYVVITSVCRDDLEDEGASHFAETIRQIKKATPKTIVEPLIPDFSGRLDLVNKILAAGPEVVSHNLETVKRLTPIVRDSRFTYEQSLEILRKIKQMKPDVYTKSSLMLGFGEKEDEVINAAKDLRAAGVDIITMGQYLQPSRKHLDVVDFVTPAKFKEYQRKVTQLGFAYAACGPLVRSSYRAAEYFLKNVINSKQYQN